ncbi:MAG: hypothetical protein A2V70_00765 [Planctomycetes bacterium RBG_13_63_9]|nr:MAG: hypothetical protein A2V70_00765 [Planctomycetes bacterium RBG_13_63_9]
MVNRIVRREFLAQGMAAASAVVATPLLQRAAAAEEEKPVRLGFVGVGGRGTGLMQIVVRMQGVTVPAVCDVNPAAVARAQKVATDANQEKPEGYQKGPEDFRRMVQRDDLDAVITATPWEWHTPVAVAAMQAGKYAATEVPAALTLEECWQLVRTSEASGMPCMMLENWSFRRDNLAVLNMIRAGLLGEIVHCHCAHSHNCMHWYFDGQGNPRWSGEHLLRRNADQYPTHSLGPVLSWMDIHCGDRIDHLVAMSTRSLGIKDQLVRKYGDDHPAAKLPYQQGDIITTLAKTAKGNTIVVNMDMQLPRPYDNRWMIQGTRGLYNEQRNAVYLEGVSPQHEQWEPFPPYQEKYDHSLWKNASAEILSTGHGGPDGIELREFIASVRKRTQAPIDVYDSVVMSVILPLSQQSIAQGSLPVKCPDFTGGKWESAPPKFAVDS